MNFTILSLSPHRLWTPIAVFTRKFHRPAICYGNHHLVQFDPCSSIMLFHVLHCFGSESEQLVSIYYPHIINSVLFSPLFFLSKFSCRIERLSFLVCFLCLKACNLITLFHSKLACIGILAPRLTNVCQRQKCEAWKCSEIEYSFIAWEGSSWFFVAQGLNFLLHEKSKEL